VIVRAAINGPDQVPAHRSTMPQINMIPHPVTLYLFNYLLLLIIYF